MVDKVCCKIFIDMSNSNIEVIKIQELNKENTKKFKIKYCKSRNT